MKKLIIYTLMGFSFSSVSAQMGLHHSSAKNLSLAGSAGVSLSGWEAVGLNPAATGQPGKSRASIGTLTAGAMVTNTALSFKFYGDYFTGETVNGKLVGKDLDPHKNDIFDRFADDEDMSAAGTVIPFAASMDWNGVGSFSLIYALKAEGKGHFHQDVMKLWLNGVEPGSNFDLGENYLETIMRAEWALGYSRSIAGYIPFMDGIISDLNAGGAIKFEQGLNYFNLNVTKNTLSVSDDRIQRHQFDYTISMAGNDKYGNWFRSDELDRVTDDWFFTPAGYGLGLDLGISGNLFKTIPIYVSVTDIGWINWTQNGTELSGSGDITYLPAFREPGDDTPEKAVFADTSLSGKYTPVRKKKEFTTLLPTMLNAGISLPMKSVPFLGKLWVPGELTFYGSFQQALVETPASSFIPRVSVGGDWKLGGMWHVRTGFSGGGKELFNWGLGGGIETKYVIFDLGTANFHNLFAGSDFRKTSVAATLQFLIP